MDRIAKAEGIINDLAQQMRFEEPILVTRPTMPRFEDYVERLRPIWESRWLTNMGPVHDELEEALRRYLEVQHLSLMCNGTMALMVALQALRITGGEVITTPFTYPPSIHVLYWNRIRPVFVDIEPRTFTIDPANIEAHITPDTQAILGVHVYGNPCDVASIQRIADRHGLKVIYDAAQVFGVALEGRSLLEWGDLSTLSFHATKIYSTVEGGAIVASNREQKERIDFLKNFGIADEETVIGPGINGKMNEFQAAFGLLRLAEIDDEIAHRHTLADIYRRELAGMPGLKMLGELPGVRRNYAYFPILVDAAEYGVSRDELYTLLKKFNIHPRKYFYPLCSSYPCYAGLPSADPRKLPISERVARQVLCLPIYGTLETTTVEHICKVIQEIGNLRLV